MLTACIAAGCAQSPGSHPPIHEADATATAVAEPSAEMLAASEKLQRVGYRLKAGAAAWCARQVQAETGLSFRVGAAELGPESNALLKTRVPQVLHVAAGSAADAAGIRPLDRVMAADGAVVAEGPQGLKQLHDWLGRLATATRSATLTLQRDGAVVEARLTPRIVCDFGVALVDDLAQRCQLVDGRIVRVSRGMVQAEEDGALAFAIAHSASHGLMHHLGGGRASQNVAQVLDVPFFVFGFAMAIASMGAYPEPLATPLSNLNESRMHQSELDADRWALYMVNAAGFAPSTFKPPIFDDIGRPSNPSPRWRERVAEFDKTGAKIGARKPDDPPSPTDEDLADLAQRVGYTKRR